MRVDMLLKRATERLAGSPSARADSETLLTLVLGTPRSWVHTHATDLLEPEVQREFNALLDRRLRGEPVAYLTGTREFWSLPLEVNPDVLIPRPETELLVELTLGLLPENEPRRVADLGTGSGAIALALASERPGIVVLAVEAVAGALDVARRNAQQLGIGRERVVFLAGDWYEPLAGERFDLIVSNPPYVRSDDPHLEQGDVRFEPRQALDGGPDGLDAIRRIIADAPFHLVRGGALILEHGHDQQPAVIAEIKDVAPNAAVEAHDDHAGVPRAVVARFT